MLESSYCIVQIKGSKEVYALRMADGEFMDDFSCFFCDHSDNKRGYDLEPNEIKGKVYLITLEEIAFVSTQVFKALQYTYRNLVVDDVTNHLDSELLQVVATVY